MKQACTHAAFSLAILLAWCTCAFALDPLLDISQYAHTAWKVRDGFTKGGINALAQTQDGYLWLGTEFGLYRFDGVRAVPWQPPTGERLPSNAVFSLLVARDGTLWIGTTKGLGSWMGGKLTTYPELAGRQLGPLLEDREGMVWVGTYAVTPPGLLCAIRSGNVQCYGKDGSLGTGVTALYEDTKGTLWVALENGFWRWKPGTSEFFSIPVQQNPIRAFAESDQGGLLVGNRDGIRRLLNGRVETYSLPGPAQISQVYAMLRDGDGGLWIGTFDHGVIHVHQGRTDTLSQSGGLSGNFVEGFLEDREGNLWVAPYDGLDRFRQYAVPTTSVKQGLPEAWSVLAARDGTLWIGTVNGLSRCQDGKVSPFGHDRDGRKPDGKLNRLVPGSLFQDSSGRIWVATTNGEVGYLENDRFVPASGDLPRGFVPDVVELSPGHLWIAHRTGGLFHLFQRKLVQQIPWPGLGHNDYALAMVADPSQRGIWLGFLQGGVAYFVDGALRQSYSSGNGLGEGMVTELRFGSSGTLWAATQGGLSRIRDGYVATLTSKNGLPCDTVNWSMEDDDHSMWLYMPCGLVRISQPEMAAWAADTTRAVKVALFDASDGVRSHFSPGGYKPLVTKAPDGKIWFVPYDGVSVIDPHHLPFNKLPPPVHIEKITADEKSYHISNGLRLPPHVRDLSIEYTALSLVVPEKVRFRVKIEGQDRDWRELTDRHVHYTNLPPKHYRFRVLACNNSGVWNEEGATLDFVIPPAWYQTNWFRAVCVAAFFLLLWSAHLLRVRHLRRQEKKLRDVVETMPTFAWTALPDGSVDFVNRHWQEFTGLSIEKTVGSGWESAVHSADVKRHVEKWRASLATGEPFENEVRYRQGENGQYRWFLARAVPLRDGKGNIVKWYGVSTDIEDRKRAEQEREKLREDLAHVNRVSMLGELSASLSHELKQPITAAVISANTTLEWLNRKQPDVENARESTATIVTAGMRAAEIIDRLRSLYKKAPPQRQLLDVNEIVGEMIALLRSEGTSYAISMRADLAPDLPQVMADRVQLQQVLMNLMLNAIEAMKETGGVLTVKSQPQDGHVVVSVSDTGVGLPPEKAERIFDTFFTTKPQGSGMGLAISRSIIESHGGRLWATPNNGRGARFHFSLPTAAEGVQLPATGM